ncbi:MAG: hypothetical protein QMC67_07875 [Candidatus Wallbacteria bacterium]
MEVYNSCMFVTPPIKKDLYNDYDELYKFLDEYKNKKITINELTSKGFNYLKTKERDILENKCSKDMKSIKNNSPVVYLFHIYKHYDELTPESKRLVENSIWDARKFFNKTFTPAEINLMKSTGKFDIKNQRGEFITNAYDLIESFQLLVDNKYMNYAEAAVYMTMIASHWNEKKQFFPLKYNIDLKQFWFCELLVNQWIFVNLEKIYETGDEYSIRMLQIFSKCALAKNVHKFEIVKNFTENIPAPETIEVNGKKIIVMFDEESFDYFNSDENGEVDNKNNAQRYLL